MRARCPCASLGSAQTNPEFMLRKCASSCGLCTHVCQDHHESCSGWAQLDNGCEDNRLFMLKNCPASCGVCHTLLELKNKATKEEL